MCTLNNPIKTDSLIIYKLVYKVYNEATNEAEYYSIFAGTPVKLGKVVEQTIASVYFVESLIKNQDFTLYSEDRVHGIFQEEHVGRISGFETLDAAWELRREWSAGNVDTNAVILKIEISDDLIEGIADNMFLKEEYKDEIVYAGRWVNSIEEL